MSLDLGMSDCKTRRAAAQRCVYRGAIIAMMAVIAVATACASGGPCPACASFDALRWCNDSGGTACSAEVPTGSCAVSRPVDPSLSAGAICQPKREGPIDHRARRLVPRSDFRSPHRSRVHQRWRCSRPLGLHGEVRWCLRSSPSQTGTIVTFQCDAPPGLATLEIECRRATMRVQPSFRFMERGCREPLLTCKSEP